MAVLLIDMVPDSASAVCQLTSQTPPKNAANNKVPPKAQPIVSAT